MHYTQGSSTPQYSYASAKVPVPSQASSPAWSEHSFGTPSSSAPTAPYMTSVPLPQGASLTPNPYGLMTPTISPQGPPILNPLLRYNPSGNVRCDISRDVTEIRLRQDTPVSVLDEPAENPPTTRMIINIENFPQWTIKVRNPHGVTVRDVLAEICATMKYSVNNTEFNAFDKEIRNATSAAFHQRSQGDLNALNQGLQRFHFMGNFFVGLKVSAGFYVICFSSP